MAVRHGVSWIQLQNPVMKSAGLAINKGVLVWLWSMTTSTGSCCYVSFAYHWLDCTLMDSRACQRAHGGHANTTEGASHDGGSMYCCHCDQTSAIEVASGSVTRTAISLQVKAIKGNDCSSAQLSSLTGNTNCSCSSLERPMCPLYCKMLHLRLSNVSYPHCLTIPSIRNEILLYIMYSIAYTRCIVQHML